MLNLETSPIIKLPIRFDIDLLNQDFDKIGIFEKLGEINSVALMHRHGALDPWSDGITTATLKKDQPLYFSEADFNQFNPGLSESYFRYVHDELAHEFKGRLGRVRLFRREPQTSSSLHQDLDVRFHIALQTNPAAFLVFPELGVFHIPADGHVYLVDTTRPHLAVNGSSSLRRLHIVFSTYCGIQEHRSNEKLIIEAHRSFFVKVKQMFMGTNSVSNTKT